MSVETTSCADIDRALDALAGAAEAWARLDIRSRMALLAGVGRRTGAHAARWVEVTLGAKGLGPDSALAGEEWLSGPYAVLTWADAHLRALDRLRRGETSYEPRWVRSGIGGETVVDVLPAEWSERLLLSGHRATVRMQPEVTPSNLAEHTAGCYRRPRSQGGVCVVLGAGNIASIAPLDVLYKLYAQGEVVVLKMNPVNQALGPVLEEVFAEYVERGFLRFVYGGAEVGAYLTTHPGVGSIHVTGSQRTHDLIVFGPGEEGAARKRRGEPKLDKPISSELGGVSPAIVVPGPWSERDLRYQAEHVATQKLHNAGFNCIATQVLVLPADWPHAERFVERVERTVAAAPRRAPYYPGADERHRRAVERHPRVVDLGADVLRAHLRDVPPDGDSFVFREELFAPVLASTRLPGGADDAGDYLDAAVAFANEVLHGTLGATLLVHPRTVAALGERFERAVARLRYGCVGINVWSGFGFLTPRAPWGGYPGASLADVESGRGTVHNALLFDRALQTVVRGPFRPFPRAWLEGELHLAPKPPWFVTNATGARTSRLITEFARERKPWLLPPLFASALRG